MHMLINPGSGPVGDGDYWTALANITRFIKELGLNDPPITVDRPAFGRDDDRDGRWAFTLHRGSRSASVDMPGIPVRDIIAECIRLYVDGNSWYWEFALSWARDILWDHDRSIQRRVDASERRCDKRLSEQPRCPTCNTVLNKRNKTIKLKNGARIESEYEIECLECTPKIVTHREDWRGSRFGDDGWKRQVHFVVKTREMPREVPGHDDWRHPDALCGLTDYRNRPCRLARTHRDKGTACESSWKEVSRVRVDPNEQSKPGSPTPGPHAHEINHNPGDKR